MSKKIINIVITLVAKNKECYSADCKKIIHLLKQNNIKDYKTKNLSSLVKDFYMIMDLNSFHKMKKLVKKDSDINVIKEGFKKIEEKFAQCI